LARISWRRGPGGTPADTVKDIVVHVISDISYVPAGIVIVPVSLWKMILAGSESGNAA
jgi:hypothetical protein